MSAAPNKTYTPEEYFELEENSEMRHEFINGEIYELASASAEHNLIAGNIYVAVRSQLAKTCRAFITEMRVQVPSANSYLSPDVLLVCGKIEFEAERDDVITNPTVIFEVLPDETRDYDRTFKFALYRKLASLQEYVMVDQSRAYVERFQRMESGLWVYEPYENMEDVLRLQSVEVETPLEEIYEGVLLEEEKE